MGEAAKWSLEGGTEPWFYDFGVHQNHLEGLLKHIAASHLQFQVQSLCMRRCISIKFLGDSGIETTRREALG